jgi:hypothetical protein
MLELVFEAPLCIAPGQRRVGRSGGALVAVDPAAPPLLVSRGRGPEFLAAGRERPAARPLDSGGCGAGQRLLDQRDGIEDR